MNTNFKKWKFTRYDFYMDSSKTKVHTWEFHGTKEQAKKKYDELIQRNFSPYTTFDYEQIDE